MATPYHAAGGAASNAASNAADRSDPDAYAFPPDGATWHISRELALLIYGPAAVVLQVAHPKVAAGVRDHSALASDPLGRLHRTMDATYAIAFGTVADARAAASGVGRMHARVRGTVGGGGEADHGPLERAAPRASGSADAPPVTGAGGYSALDQDLVMWVAATLAACGVAAYERFVAPMSAGEKSAYFADMRRFGRYFGLRPDHGPQTWPAFEDYFAATLADPALGSHPVSREVAWAVARPPQWHLYAGRLPARWLLAETLPRGVADRLGFASTRSSRSAVAAFTATVRRAIPLLPARLRFAPAYLTACHALGRDPFAPARPIGPSDQVGERRE